MSQYREPVLSLNEQSFVRTSLAASLRLDGRAPLDMREVVISFPAPGSAQVQLGTTRVMAVTTADLVQPFPDRPNEGALNLFVNFSPMASPAYEPGHPSERGVEMSRLVERALRESRALDLESLCVLSGEKVWAVRLDAHVLDQGGNVMDCLSLACVGALASFRRPDITVVGDQVTVHSVEDRQPVPLAMHHLPISCTFAFFDPTLSAASAGAPAALMLLDPSLKEEQCADALLTFTLNVHGEICTMQKSGGLGLSMEDILMAGEVARGRVVDLTGLLQGRLKEEASRANSGNALRGGQRSVPVVYHVPGSAAPIDAFGSNVTKPAGQHQVAGKPIEVRMGGPNPSSSSSNKQGGQREESEEEEDEEDNEEEGEEEEDSDMADREEMAQVAAKLQANHAATTSAAATPAAAAAGKGKKK